MKKIIVLSFGLLVLLSGGCKKNNPLNPLGAVACASNAEKLVAALNRVTTEGTNAACEAYKKEAADFLKSCPAYYTGADKKELEEWVNEPCDIEKN